MFSAIGAPAKEPLLIGKSPRGESAEAVSIAGLRHAFAELEVIAELGLGVASGEVVGVVGPSGCGKSTLLELVCGLREPLAGSLQVFGASAAGERLAHCAYMPQRDLLLPWLPAIDNAALALRNRGLRRRAARAPAAALFERFGLKGFEGARPAELSGGMRQRVAFLRTLIAGKPLLLLDEPFASLDAITRGEMQEWLAAALATDGRTVLIVTHDVEEALYLSDRVVVLSSRPARTVPEIAVSSPRHFDRDELVTSPEFAALRERAMRALREGSQ